MSLETLNILNPFSTMVNLFRMKILFIITDSLGTRCLKNQFWCNPSKGEKSHSLCLQAFTDCLGTYVEKKSLIPPHLP